MDVVTWAADKWSGRQKIVIRVDTDRHFIGGTVGGPWIYSCSGTIRIYNGGPHRVTVNQGWWETKDGGRVEAHVPRERSINPGDPELILSSDKDELIRAAEEHGGLTKVTVLLAGEDKPREGKIPKGWLEQLRGLRDQD